MRRVTCHLGRLQFDDAFDVAASHRVDSMLSDTVLGLERGHVHELLVPLGTSRAVVAGLCVGSVRTDAYVWCGSAVEPYPPALAAAGVPLDRVYLIRPRNRLEMLWAAAEMLRCPSVGVTIAAIDRLTPVEARRLQLAAERGGGIGLLIRPPDAPVHAARTRWVVRPAPGEALTQRWRLQLVHGHGRPTDQSLTLEMNRETNHVRAAAALAHRPREATPARIA